MDGTIGVMVALVLGGMTLGYGITGATATDGAIHGDITDGDMDMAIMAILTVMVTTTHGTLHIMDMDMDMVVTTIDIMEIGTTVTIMDTATEAMP